MEIREVPFIAMGGIYEADDLEAVNRVTAAALGKSGNFFPLPEEGEFQNRFAAHEGADFAVATNSCGTALDCCMMALGIGPGDEVITTPLTFVCTAGCVVGRGGQVVLQISTRAPSTWILSKSAGRLLHAPGPLSRFILAAWPAYHRI